MHISNWIAKVLYQEKLKSVEHSRISTIPNKVSLCVLDIMKKIKKGKHILKNDLTKSFTSFCAFILCHTTHHIWFFSSSCKICEQVFRSTQPDDINVHFFCVPFLHVQDKFYQKAYRNFMISKMRIRYRDFCFKVIWNLMMKMSHM